MALVCAGYGFVAASVCADVVNYSTCVCYRGQLQHVGVLLNHYTLQYEHMPTWLMAACACVCALISTSVC